MEFIIHKYKGSNYFNSDTTYIDKIVFTEMYKEGFPIFSYDSKDISGIAIYKAGEFDLTISLLQTNKSVNGLSIKDFFLGSDRDYMYLINVFIGSQKFSGIAYGSDVRADFTYPQNKNEVTIAFKDILQEWKAKCEKVTLSTLHINNGDILTFEQYVIKHFSGLTGSKVLISAPVSKTYLQRLQEFNGVGGLPPAGVWFYGDYFNFITGKDYISRWETWMEFVKGIGCNFKMEVNGFSANELPNEPEYQFQIFFVDDLESETPATIQMIEHREFTTIRRLKWLYLRYRSLVLDGVDYSSGIVFSQGRSYYSDADNAGNHLYPALLLQFDGKILSYDNGVSGEIILTRDIDFNELELKQYNYSFTPGIPIGKLYPLDEADGGGMAYSQCMMALTANQPPPTRDFDRYNHIPVNRYAIKNYRRYLDSIQKAKEFKVIFNDTTNIKLWKTIQINDFGVNELYYISSISNIDLQNETADIECIKIKTL